VRHDRKVALKVLRPELSAILGAERFLTEIKTTAHLQHPHILPLHDSGEADGLVYYVMPYVEGESLRDRLHREKQLPVEDAVRIAREVADALEYAHEQGVVHRDIKPENILLHGGHALVADFGIALAAARTDGAARLTETGMSLGTPHYMAPEQAMGEREITPKADIYALGVVLYEMLSGEPPFVGPTAQAIIARVMTEEPRSLTLHRHTIPPHLEAAVRRALEKLPADRFQSAAALAEALTHPGVSTAVTAPPPRVARRRFPWLAAAVGVVVLGAGYAAGRLARPAPAASLLGRFTIPVEPFASLGSGFAPGVALSADGSRIAFIGRGPRGNQVYLRARDDSVPRPVVGTELAFAPLFSPDGREIVFWAAQRLAKVPLEGGTPMEVAADAGNAAAWLDDGTIAYVDSRQRALFVTAAGSTREVMRTDTASIVSLTGLPGGKAVLAGLLGGGRNRISIVAISLRDGSMREVGLSDALKARYLPSGHVVYQRRTGGALLAAPFDLGALQVTGEGRPVAPPARITFRVIPQWDAADNGTIAYLGVAPFELVQVSRAGQVTVLQGEPRSYHHPRVSPDGRRVVLDITEGDARDLWVVDLRDRTLTRLTVGEIANDPYWSPRDGRELIYREDAGMGSRLVAAEIRTSPTFEVVRRTPLFDVSSYVVAEDHANYDIHPDARSFIMVRSPQASQIHVVLNAMTQLSAR
jgi:serine/threonine-protein kinase